MGKKDSFLTVGRRLLTLVSFEPIPLNVERCITSDPRVAWACEITLSICGRIGSERDNYEQKSIERLFPSSEQCF